MQKRQIDDKFRKALPETAKMIDEANKIEAIYNYLDLNDVKDGRLVVKADIMKKVIYYTSQWKSGNKLKWIDKLATRTCVSTRKIREDYVRPLISDGILEEFENGFIRFIGLPK